MTTILGLEKPSVLRAMPRLIQIVRVLARRRFLGALVGNHDWPSPRTACAERLQRGAMNNFTLMNQVVFDWLDEVFA